MSPHRIALEEFIGPPCLHKSDVMDTLHKHQGQYSTSYSDEGFADHFSLLIDMLAGLINRRAAKWLAPTHVTLWCQSLQPPWVVWVRHADAVKGSLT